MYLIELLFNSLQSQNLWMLGKSHWNWVQTDLTRGLLGESVPSWRLTLRLVLVQLRILVSMPEGDCYILFSVVMLRIEILLLAHTSKSSLSPVSLEFGETW